MSGIAPRSQGSQGFQSKTPFRARPAKVEHIVEVLSNPKRFPSPVRPVGANSGNPRCTATQDGTWLDMTAMNRVLELTPRKVTVQAGMRLRDLVRELAVHGLELANSFEQPDRTVGGLVSGGALGWVVADAGRMDSVVCGLGIVTPQGRVLDIDERRPEMLSLLMHSYGLLGIIHSVTLRVRRARSYSVRSTRLSFTEYGKYAAGLIKTGAGVKLYLLPFRDRVLIELREASSGGPKASMALAWRLRDWLMDKLVPDLVYWLGRGISSRRLRDPLIDGFSEATQVLVNTRLVDAGTNAMEQTGKFRRIGPAARIQSCTWFFPAERFGALLFAYRAYCARHYKLTGFRCDLPTVCYRTRAAEPGLLSPAPDGPAFALSLRSTQTEGWDNFLLDFSSIAARFGGLPSFNLTRHFTPAQAAQGYGSRLERFRELRRKSDPGNRLLNQFFAEFLG